MSQGVSAAEILRSEWREHSVFRTCIRIEYEDCSNRVKEAKKEIRKIERAIPNKELLVRYGKLMIRNKEDEDAMEDKETDIEFHEREIARLNNLMEEEEAKRKAGEGAEIQQAYSSKHSARSFGRPPRATRKGTGHRTGRTEQAHGYISGFPVEGPLLDSSGRPVTWGTYPEKEGAGWH